MADLDSSVQRQLPRGACTDWSNVGELRRQGDGRTQISAWPGRSWRDSKDWGVFRCEPKAANKGQWSATLSRAVHPSHLRIAVHTILRAASEMVQTPRHRSQALTCRRLRHHLSQSSHFSSCLTVFVLTSLGSQARPTVLEDAQDTVSE